MSQPATTQVDPEKSSSQDAGPSPVPDLFGQDSKLGEVMTFSTVSSQNLGQPHNQAPPLSHASEDARPREWKTTLIRFGPLSGLCGMLLAALSVVASLGILAGSNGAPTKSWRTPPSTYLAIFTAIANQSMRYAAIQGVVIAWWLRAITGTSIERLQRDWRSGTSFRSAILAGRRMGSLGLACLFSVIVVIDGALLQRSSTVDYVAFAGPPINLNVVMAPEVPRGASPILFSE